jgi:hypothetical protein
MEEGQEGVARDEWGEMVVLMGGRVSEQRGTLGIRAVWEGMVRVTLLSSP